MRFGNCVFRVQFCHDVLMTPCAMLHLHGILQLRQTMNLRRLPSEPGRGEIVLTVSL